MKKKIFSIIFALVLCVIMLPLSGCSSENAEVFKCNVTETKQFTKGASIDKCFEGITFTFTPNGKTKSVTEFKDGVYQEVSYEYEEFTSKTYEELCKGDMNFGQTIVVTGLDTSTETPEGTTRTVTCTYCGYSCSFKYTVKDSAPKKQNDGTQVS